MDNRFDRAALVVVDDQKTTRERVHSMLERRFGPDYEVIACATGVDGYQTLFRLYQEQREVALVLARQDIADLPGIKVLLKSYKAFPDAGRLVLCGIRQLYSAREEILRAASAGVIDSFLSIPEHEHDEPFFRAVSQFIEDWDREHRPQTEVLRIVGDPWDPACQHLRDSLQRSGVFHGFYPADSERGRELLASVNCEGPLPVVITIDNEAISQPTTAEVAELLQVNVAADGRDYDTVVVGAGPAGLSAAVYAASEGLDCLVVEGEALGGQASTSSLIRNYLGFPRGLSGAELASRAYLQAWFFGARFNLGRQATEIREEGPWRVVGLHDGSEVRARTVVLAAGVNYRRLGIESVERFEGRGVFYGAPVTEAWAVADDHAVVIGGGNSSAQSALYLSRWANDVTLVARHPELDEMSQYLVRDIEAHPRIKVRLSTLVLGATGEERLDSVTLQDRITGEIDEVPAAALFIMIGAEPGTDWLPRDILRDGRGYVLTGDEVARRMDGRRAPLPLETSMPGVFAVGDVREGGMKRVASAVGEGSNAIRHVHTYLADHSREFVPELEPQPDPA
ncbi:MAG TPA: FAD-dependent oxidoreductase [Candidatus Limnocylindrales bacterium]